MVQPNNIYKMKEKFRLAKGIFMIFLILAIAAVSFLGYQALLKNKNIEFMISDIVIFRTSN